jgi:hypothetical protein
MAGFETVKIMRDFERACYELGFEITKSLHNPAGIALKARDDCFPHYSRDAELFSGSVEEALLWLRGLLWARDYDDMLKLSNDKKRGEQEQKERNRQLMRSIKTGCKVKGRLDSHDGSAYDIEYDDDMKDEVPF